MHTSTAQNVKSFLYNLKMANSNFFEDNTCHKYDKQLTYIPSYTYAEREVLNHTIDPILFPMLFRRW